MGYQILYLQLLGFSGSAVGLISAFLVLGAAAGFISGGALGDVLHMRSPNAARVLVNQLSLVVTVPITFALFKGMPGVQWPFSSGVSAPGPCDIGVHSAGACSLIRLGFMMHCPLCFIAHYRAIGLQTDCMVTVPAPVVRLPDSHVYALWP